MGYFAININERYFSEGQIIAINTLAKERKLGEIVAKLLRDHLNNLNPDLQPTRTFIGTPQDIDTFILKYQEENPNETRYVLNLMQERMGKALSIRPFYLDEIDKVLK